jgi:hypothetical protein
MTLEPSSNDPGCAFAACLGELVLLLRGGHADSAEQARLLGTLVRPGEDSIVTIEAGVEHSWLQDDSLKGRLLARGVDLVRIAPAASAAELLAFARALAHDTIPIPSTPAVDVNMVPLPRQAHVRHADRLGAQDLPFFTPSIGEVRSTLRPLVHGGAGDETARLEVALLDAIRRDSWVEAAHMVQALIRMLPMISEVNRRSHAIAMRRHLTQPVLEALIDTAFRVPEEQNRIGEVLRWAGLGAGELMLDIIRRSEQVGPRAFLFEALGGMPDAYPFVLPLLASSYWHEVRHAADLLGRMGDARAIEPLSARLNHPDERVRIAIIDALGRFRDRVVVEPLRQALSHASPATRAQAGRALAARRSGALAMPLLAALEIEKDSAVWRELLQALTLIDAAEATQALVRLATERRSLLGRGGYTAAQRLLVVEMLAESGTLHARQALERIGVEGDAPVKEAAHRALEGWQ